MPNTQPTITRTADPLAASYISMVHRLLDELGKTANLTKRVNELETELAGRNEYDTTVAGMVSEAFTDLDAEADAYNLCAPFPVRDEHRIYNTWADVPDGVVYESLYGNDISHWVNRDGMRWLALDAANLPSEIPSQNSAEAMTELAPFVAVAA